MGFKVSTERYAEPRGLEYTPLDLVQGTTCRSPNLRSFLDKLDEEYEQFKADTPNVWGNRRRLHTFYVRYTRRVKKVILLDRMGGKCAQCGYAEHPDALDFDHLPGFEKRSSVSLFLNAGKYKEAEDEAKKCQILCANCHRIVTQERRGGLLSDTNALVTG